MFKFRANSVFRFNLLVVFVFITGALYVLINASIIIFMQRENWKIIAENHKPSELEIKPIRGNILNDKGELMVSTLPLYKIHLDFVYKNENNQIDELNTTRKRDSLWKNHIGELCAGLNKIFPEKSAADFEKDLMYGFRNKKRYHWLYNRKISYTQYNRILALPIMNQGRKYSGIIVDEEIERKNIFKDIGKSTFGVVRNTTNKKGEEIEELSGIEKMYDSYLRGVPGVAKKEKVSGHKTLAKIKTPAKNGIDVQTTINSEMLDICESAVKRVLRENHLPAGWAILMETKSGDIKAIVNLTHWKNGIYIETTDNIPNNPTPNHALCRLMEPGSIFKTVALTAAIEDGKLRTTDSVIAYPSKVHNFNGKNVTDEMYRDNGTGKYSMAEALKYSSNISMVQYIKKAYGKAPQEYTNTLLRFGLTENYKLIESEMTPYLTLPKSKSWNKLSLNSMSYGYAVGMTGINMIVFYNTIANGGKQMRPRLVSAILDNGNIVEEYPTEVLKEQMISKETADAITGLLVEVVNGKDGTGKRAKSENMIVAGKTGTANIPNSITGQYDNSEKMMSFCGFFPADEPQYTLLVQMMYDAKQDTRPKEEKKKLGGGSTAAVAFKEIAEKVMSKRAEVSIEELPEITDKSNPTVKNGNLHSALYILDEMEMNVNYEVDNIYSNQDWGTIRSNNENKYDIAEKDVDKNVIPDVRGMGAKEASYLLQNRDMRVEFAGYGTVRTQSIAPGSRVRKGATIRLTLEP